MLNLEQHLISFIQKAVALTIRLRWGFVILLFLCSIYIFIGFFALLLSIVICAALVAIGYSEAEKEEDELNEFIEKLNESIRKILEKFFRVKYKITTEEKNKYKYITLFFFHLVKIDNKKNKFSLLVFSIILIIFQFYLKIYNYNIFIPFIFLIILIAIKEQLLEYRIRKGLFGTNRTEARELIDFIIKNSDNLDFTDSNGNLRRALLPEAKDTAEEHIPGTLGEEARA